MERLFHDGIADRDASPRSIALHNAVIDDDDSVYDSIRAQPEKS